MSVRDQIIVLKCTYNATVVGLHRPPPACLTRQKPSLRSFFSPPIVSEETEKEKEEGSERRSEIIPVAVVVGGIALVASGVPCTFARGPRGETDASLILATWYAQEERERQGKPRRESLACTSGGCLHRL